MFSLGQWQQRTCRALLSFAVRVTTMTTVTINRKKVLVYTVLACVSELVFSGVLNGWSALYLIFNPQTSDEIVRTNWIYSIANIAAIIALVPQGAITDCISSRFLFISHTIIGILGYGLMIFASWFAGIDQANGHGFCSSLSTWALFIVSQVLTSICSNGMHLAIMCYIPTISKRWSDEKASQSTVMSVLYTVTNGFYALGPLLVFIVYKSVGVQNWLGLAWYAGFTVLALIIVSVALYALWDEVPKYTWLYADIEWRKVLSWDVLEFVVYNSVYNYFIICFIAMQTARAPWFLETFSYVFPLIGLAMTIVLSCASSFTTFWKYDAWTNKFCMIAVVGCLWSMSSLWYSCFLYMNPKWLWICSCVLFCVLCPIYYSVIAYYLDGLCQEEFRGIMRGLITALGGPPLFSISAWIEYGTIHHKGYVAFDTLNISLCVVVSVALLLRHFRTWK